MFVETFYHRSERGEFLAHCAELDEKGVPCVVHEDEEGWTVLELGTALAN